MIDREKSLLPQTQITLSLENEREELIKQFKEKENELYRKINELRTIYHKKIDEVNMKLNNKKKKREKQFKYISKCCVDECRGYLQVKTVRVGDGKDEVDEDDRKEKIKMCGLCKTTVCFHCEKDINIYEFDTHTCDEGDVETLKMIQKDTKNCPSCTIPIHKIDGCDQMYCVECHTAFSWITGKIETGVIHNPHYYQYQKQINNGQIPRNPGDNPYMNGCVENNILRYYTLTNLIQKEDNYTKTFLGNCHRLWGHVDMVVIPKYNGVATNHYKEKYRKDYLNNKIDEKKWKISIKSLMKKEEKYKHYYDVLVMFKNTLKDIFDNLSVEKKDYGKYVKQIETLISYVNDQFCSIGYYYKNVCPQICVEKNGNVDIR